MICLKAKVVFGKTLYYPDGVKAQALAAIAGKKTFSLDDMANMKKLGLGLCVTSGDLLEEASKVLAVMP